MTLKFKSWKLLFCTISCHMLQIMMSVVFCCRVTSYQEFNRMHIPNLAIVFGPTLMWPEAESANMALDLMQQNLVIECFLQEFDSIFHWCMLHMKVLLAVFCIVELLVSCIFLLDSICHCSLCKVSTEVLTLLLQWINKILFVILSFTHKIWKCVKDHVKILRL